MCMKNRICTGTRRLNSIWSGGGIKELRPGAAEASVAVSLHNPGADEILELPVNSPWNRVRSRIAVKRPPPPTHRGYVQIAAYTNTAEPQAPSSSEEPVYLPLALPPSASVNTPQPRSKQLRSPPQPSHWGSTEGQMEIRLD
ncbi:hypothetical protein AAFF_G00413470 [Aldrovandia affinis]|uniref:Uncharacterized protein n=1 Tax=Aldrovandia affinis TaxID=143900 RepID=A0AAD7SB48_9TELE|nr:hypothetical protein AAFF_G00413470 [Aldrovandia affinis]